MSRPRGVGAAVRAIAARPRLWPTALVVGLRLAPRGWWRKWPPVPWPDEDYWRFRMETAYGGEGNGVPEAADVVEFLVWCRSRWRRPTSVLR